MRTQNQHPEPAGPRRRESDRDPAGPVSRGELDARKLVQELQLHKIELEMQNEELRRAHEEIRVSRAQIDQRVVSRTAELARAIESLSAEVQVRYQAEQSLNGAFTELEVRKNRLQAENVYLHLQLDWRRFQVLIGTSAAVAELRSRIEAAAALETPVLLLGEVGTGKGMAACALHNLSARRHRPMVTLSCASVEPELLEGMLFGEPKGAPARHRIGQFELADQGTLFLDEIGALPLGLQGRLLDAILGRAPLPGPPAPKPDVRIIAASNRPLPEEVRAGRFREDLYECLCACHIPVPPLRERREDIPDFVAAFMARFNRILGSAIRQISDRTMGLLMVKAWPGNIRELENLIELGMITSRGPSLELPARQRDLS
jgi:DNA-binding NtrC family response regulator